MNRTADQIAELAVAELRQYMPGLNGVEPVRTRVLKEKRATFDCRPGIDRHRPATCGAIGQLHLAGDWVDTGWPATMEGAARSGYMAAAAARGLEPREGLVADLKPSWLCRLLGFR